MLADIGSLLISTFLLVVSLLAPFVGFALIIHWLERITFVRLAERFGWRVVLVTGWLGTPIHELSHAAMCLVFRHRIDELALFEPDLQSGRLGYVRHSYRKGNWFQEVGNFFIGVAPLMGGSLALAALLWIFFGDAVHDALFTATAETSQPEAANNVFTTTWSVITSILTIENLLSLRFWVFVYLVVCVGGHMAPSVSDYQGATQGVIMVVGAIIAVALIAALFAVDTVSAIRYIMSALTPLFALFLITIATCSLATSLVFMLTSVLPATRRIR